ncbi:MAG: hypothetical protein HY898_04245 [Deltaproteobacteria bacterium]|nr:hypothetical protein [Deltaproteobacteria bacterium]
MARSIGFSSVFLRWTGLASTQGRLAGYIACAPARVALIVTTGAFVATLGDALQLPISWLVFLVALAAVLQLVALRLASSTDARVLKGCLLTGLASGVCLTASVGVADTLRRHVSDATGLVLGVSLMLLASSTLSGVVMLPLLLQGMPEPTLVVADADRRALSAGAWLVSLATAAYVFPDPSPRLAIALWMLGGAVFLGASFRALARAWWLARVRRGKVPGWDLIDRDWHASEESVPQTLADMAPDGMVVSVRGDTPDPYRTSARPRALALVPLDFRPGLRSWLSRVAVPVAAVSFAGLAGGFLAASCSGHVADALDRADRDARAQTCRELSRTNEAVMREWSPGDACPTAARVERPAPGRRGVDGWGAPIRIRCDQGQPVVASAGQDGLWGTHDDLQSPCY